MLRRSRGPAHQEPRRAATLRGFRMSGAETRRCCWVVDHMAPRRVDSFRSARSRLPDSLGCRRGPVRASESVLVMNLIASIEAYLNTPGNAASPRRFYLDEPIPEVVWPDPRDPRRTGPGFDENGRAWLIECVRGQREATSKEMAQVAFHRLHRAEDLFLEQLRLDLPDSFKPAPTADEKLPKKEYASLTKKEAGRTQYISLLETAYQAVIRIDVDEPERLADLQDLGMPPNLLGLNAGADPSHRGRFQAWWILDVPVSMANGKSVTLLRSVQAMLKAATGADKSGSGDVNRNPWYRDGAYSWHLLHRRGWKLYELKDRLVQVMADRLQLEDLVADDDAAAIQHGDDGSHVAGAFSGPRILSTAQREAQRAGRHVGEGHFRPWRVRPDGSLLRNCSLFMQVSEVARKARIRDGVVDEMDLLEILEELNGLIEEDWPSRDGLRAPELRDISRKVSRYWNRNFDPNWGGRCAFYTEEGRRLGTETMKQRGEETRLKVIDLLRSRLTNREISERIDRGVRRVQQIVRALRDEAAQIGISLDALLDLSSRADEDEGRISEQSFRTPSTSSSDRPSETLPMSLSASSSITSAPEKPSRRRTRRRRRLVSRS